MPRSIKCIVVDDEPLALRLITAFVERTPFLQICGAYLSAAEALAAITPEIQVVFLDISMPELTGLELARLLPPDVKVVFTTAYREYAFDSYNVHAADYMLKPLSYPRFLEAAQRLRELLPDTRGAVEIASPKGEARDGSTQDYIFVKCDYRLMRIDLQDILYLKGLKDYVSIYMRGRKTPLIATSTMKSMEEKLTPPRFCRVHKSYIVAMGAVEAVERSRISIGEEMIPVSEAYRSRFFSLLE